MRSRIISVDYSVLSKVSAGSSLRLNLFEDTSLDAVFETFRKTGDDSFTWSGILNDDPLSSVTISVVDDVVQGNVHSPVHGEYQIRCVSDGVHEAREVDPKALSPCGVKSTDIMPAGSRLKEPIQLAEKNKDGVYTIDVLVPYTPSALQAVGGKKPMKALINLAVAEANDAYSNSLVDVELRLVGSFELRCNEIFGSDETLDALGAMDDEFMNEVHVARDALGADMVALIINFGDDCGRGYILPSLDEDHSDLAFSVTYHPCATGSFTFAHELGHNLGCHHDLQNAPDGGLFSDSLGWHWGESTNPGYDGKYRSIMAYVPGERAQLFSNPDVMYGGEPTGVVDVADNARTLNIVAPVAAGWRETADWIAFVPRQGIDSIGPVGGPFSRSSFLFSVINLSGTLADWTLTCDKPWAKLSQTFGSLGADAQDQVKVSLTPRVERMKPGKYTASLTFTDVTNNKSFAYSIQVEVVGPPEGTQYWFPLDTDPGWSRTGQWEFGIPKGNGTNNPDPKRGFSGKKVFGNNLNGDYANNSPRQILTTNAFDCSQLKDVELSFWHWLGIESAEYDRASLQVSNDGNTWTDVWVHDGPHISEVAWWNFREDISSVADGQATVYIRWILGKTDVSEAYCGFNIDDIAIIGTPIDTVKQLP
ncbi:MAG: hypothetical protein IT366_02435 [Candidatus Hydrogenedentes bacterium]|nr:hypothetical protein [Candidatus Hydrogenedentota bacterium]